MILLVDDRHENIFSLKTVLEQHGFATDSALSGEDALKKLLKKEYALIILDVQMPGMDGFEVAEAITGLNKTKDIPIIFLSAVNTHKKFITKGFESGAVDYITKPVDPDILILKVRNFYRLYEKTHALKEAEKSLTATVSELHTTLESLPQLAFTASPEGKIEFVNRQWFLFSTSHQNFPDTAGGFRPINELWERSIEAGAEIEREVCIRRLDDGQGYYHLLRATPIKMNGRITKWVGTFTSIHEQKMLHETLEKKVAERTQQLMDINRELEISNNDLEQFTSVASHDLKEPLRKIQVFGNLLREKAALDDSKAIYLNKILHSAARMNKLITDLLSFASLSQPDIFTSTSLNNIVNDVVNDLELLIHEKKAVIVIDEMPEVEVIPGLVAQLFQNLVNNGLKFTKPGVAPRIKISAELTDKPSMESAAAPNGKWCRICVADNGIGFDVRYAEKIFTIFQRLNNNRDYEGTGIGLAIAKKIVDRHKGIINANSTPGEGSTFYVILPAKQETLRSSGTENQFLKISLA
jgi:signal transduction histidine kinase/CheY-like chemotaxis protein